jgi:hypothetical protein
VNVQGIAKLPAFIVGPAVLGEDFIHSKMEHHRLLPNRRGRKNTGISYFSSSWM